MTKRDRALVASMMAGIADELEQEGADDGRVALRDMLRTDFGGFQEELFAYLETVEPSLSREERLRLTYFPRRTYLELVPKRRRGNPRRTTMPRQPNPVQLSMTPSQYALLYDAVFAWEEVLGDMVQDGDRSKKDLSDFVALQRKMPFPAKYRRRAAAAERARGRNPSKTTKRSANPRLTRKQHAVIERTVHGYADNAVEVAAEQTRAENLREYGSAKPTWAKLVVWAGDRLADQAETEGLGFIDDDENTGVTRLPVKTVAAAFRSIRARRKSR